MSRGEVGAEQGEIGSPPAGGWYHRAVWDDNPIAQRIG